VVKKGKASSIQACGKEFEKMSTTDPIADMLTRIRNANMARHEQVNIPASKLKLKIAKILKEERFIKGYDLIKDNKQGIIKLYLGYGPGKERIMTGLKRVSKPGLRIYSKAGEIPKIRGGLGVSILSTPQGVMTGKQARRARVGGEVICYVW